VLDDMLLRERLAIGQALDALWSETMSLPSHDLKAKPLRLIAVLLHEQKVQYALIGGVAVQLCTEEPRTTLDIDLAISSYREIPEHALREAGFEHTGRFEHSDNWRAPGTGPLKARVAVQFSAEDDGIDSAIKNANTFQLEGGVPLRVASVRDLIFLKLLAAEEPQRRPSKRQHDIADVMCLMEEHPSTATPDLVARVALVQSRLLRAKVETP
jgi:Nucleotidyl transferase AbiEii toxin, Type IV TA system